MLAKSTIQQIENNKTGNVLVICRFWQNTWQTTEQICIFHGRSWWPDEKIYIEMKERKGMKKLVMESFSVCFKKKISGSYKML
jgi:hypothetical protein